MNKKILYSASTFSHIKNFHIPYLKFLKDNGCEIHVLASGDSEGIYCADKIINFNIKKRTISLVNLVTIFKFKTLIETEQYDILSLHTTLLSSLARLAVLLLKKKYKPKIVNTVHGYLFNSNLPTLKDRFKLWVEKVFSNITDELILMNNEDYNIARRYKLCTENIRLVKGMGVDFKHFSKMIHITRTSLGITDKDVVLVFAGEFSDRKNQQFLINALTTLPKKYKLLLLGTGKLFKKNKKLVKTLKLENRVYLIGYTNNIAAYYSLSDILVSASKSEGLPFNVIEAMYMGLPCVLSDIKGHQDLLQSTKNTLLFKLNSYHQFKKNILSLNNPVIRTAISDKLKKDAALYSLDNVDFNLYREVYNI